MRRLSDLAVLSACTRPATVIAEVFLRPTLGVLMTATLTTPTTPARRRLKGVGMKLISLDTQFDGTIIDILGYRTAPAGRVEVTALLDAPGAWYSRTHPVVVDASDVRLSLAVQSITRPELGVR
ncbi:hypothetical protein CH260_20340 [Rhodococcus sp. 05-2256-B2]|nr:hypothetical protein CH258_13870 [Rhodococcus sp. 05-2256-B4]OZD92443.1 hypothetical protein CH260_20340 [Rhodococcus sp. 05-2256-B2]OZD99331.1 hypothetical protein CH257_00760 [Rhodococcus sp. 05-2256-B3]OZE02855.1 hypothetical protein CH285_12875 [Rhodococcus sp. 05-2256-B1]